MMTKEKNLIAMQSGNQRKQPLTFRGLYTGNHIHDFIVIDYYVNHYVKPGASGITTVL